MDFRDTLGSYEHMLPLEIIEVETSNTHMTEETVADSKWELAETNEHLIDKCLATKRFDILAKTELEKYGKLALYSAANDFIHGLDFVDFALKRIERQMNVAIAEALHFGNAAQSNMNKTEIVAEFQSIYKRFP